MEHEQKEYVLANEKDIDGAKVELIIVWQCGIAIQSRMHSCVKLHASPLVGSFVILKGETCHDGLSFVLHYMTRPSHFIPTSKAEEHQFLRGVNRFLYNRKPGRELSFRSHRCMSVRLD